MKRRPMREVMKPVRAEVDAQVFKSLIRECGCY